jgi:hypothetical protein
MKAKLIPIQVCLLCMLSLLPIVVQAQFTFTTNDDNTITITGYTGSGSSVVIPDTTNDYPITSIGSNAFWGSSLTYVAISSNVTSIAQGAFENSVNLISVTIPNSVTNIGNNAFLSCISLTNVTIPDGVMSIGTNAFGNCYSLTSVTIPDSFTSFSDSMFSCCNDLTN